jgi:hypothetical protein
MRISIKTTLTAADVIADKLDVNQYPLVTMARTKAAGAREEHGRAHQRLVEAGQEVDRLRRAVAGGDAAIADLERALSAQHAAALVLPQFAERVTDAERSVDAAMTAAKAYVIAEAERRRDRLQQVADEFEPALTALTEAEAALDAAVRAAGGISVQAVRWPACLIDARPAMNVIPSR